MIRGFYGYFTQIFHVTLVLEIIMPTVLIPSFICSFIHSFIYAIFRGRRVSLLLHMCEPITAFKNESTLSIVGFEDWVQTFQAWWWVLLPPEQILILVWEFHVWCFNHIHATPPLLFPLDFLFTPPNLFFYLIIF